MKIFLIHKGRQEYLLYCVKQLLKYNDASDIIFLTDDKIATKNFIGEDGIIYENILDYSKSAIDFEKYYKHMSYNKKEYELFCFQRWLVIKDYVVKKKIDNFCHIDTDVLIYCNMKEYYKNNLLGYDFSCTGWSGGIFFGTKKGITEFSQFLLNIYKNKIFELELYYTGKKINSVKRGDGFIYKDETRCVTDMTLFWIFIQDYCKSLGLKHNDIGLIINNSVFDCGINGGDGFNFLFGLKNLEFIDGRPYGFIKNRKILFNGLHFQGESKMFMKYFFFNKNIKLLNTKNYIFFIKKTFIYVCIFLFKKLGIYYFMRNIWLRILGRGKYTLNQNIIENNENTVN